MQHGGIHRGATGILSLATLGTKEEEMSDTELKESNETTVEPTADPRFSPCRPHNQYTSSGHLFESQQR
jgi:hypothetical protein